MRLIFPVPVIIFFCSSANSQSNLTVVYNHTFKIISFPKQKVLDDYDRQATLYTNGDSVSFYSLSNQKPESNPATVGSKNDHHGNYYFPKLKRGLAEYAWTKPFMLEEYIPSGIEWKFHDDTMRIAGYLCKVAVADGLVAWYTTEIPVSFGPLYFNGLPGLVLMLENHRQRQLIKAASVKFDSPQIVLADLELKECKDCGSRLGEIKKYFKD